MARIATIALMLFAAAPALAQQSDTTAPAAPADSSKSAPHPNPLPAGGERERTETPAPPPPAATEASPPGATDTPPAATAPPAAAPSDTTEAPPPAAPPAPARAGNVDVRESLCLMIESAARAQNLPLEFFARVIWQESRFQADVVGPRSRSGGARHELGDALRAVAAPRARADDVGLEAALLPDHAREELERQVVRARRGFDHEAEGFAHVDVPRARRRRRCGRCLGGTGWRSRRRRIGGSGRRCLSCSGRRCGRHLGA